MSTMDFCVYLLIGDGCILVMETQCGLVGSGSEARVGLEGCLTENDSSQVESLAR